MTNWSDEQLERLVNVDNHKMVKDVAGETRWMHSLSQGKWNTHSIKVFEDEKKAYSWLYFWIPKFLIILLGLYNKGLRGFDMHTNN